MENFGCTLCPRRCGADRTRETGRCGGGARAKVARAALHFWEEPPISGTRGSGAVFFSGCPLGCVYCQNREISQGGKGLPVDTAQLANIFLDLQRQGAHNLNLVTATHYAPQVIAALEMAGDRLHIPVVCNTGGYETVETVRLLAPYVDIWLPDFKYYSSVLSGKYSGAPDYFPVACKAVKEMVRLAGPPVFDKQGLMKSGVCLRHLVLPGCRKDSLQIMDFVGDTFPRDALAVSLMRQFTPTEACSAFPELNRRLTTFEYESVEDRLRELNFRWCFVQEKGSAGKEYIPCFDYTGVL